jgi:hypothetical protein
MVRGFPSAADRDSQLAMDAVLVRSDAQRADLDARRKLTPLDALQKVLQVDLRRTDVQKVACPMAHSVESVDLVPASGELAGPQGPLSRVQSVPQASRRAVVELPPDAALAPLV